MPSAHMSSRLEDTSAILGEYMLKGWTLTDLHCDDCHTTPLMREPAGSASAAGRDRIQFCASCDVSPAGRRSGPGPSAATSSTPASFTHLQSQQINPSNQTKAQTDPSESISTLLLQGYSLLGDNCPNMSCRGIPLVGYPKKKDGSKDGRRMCVSCGGRWVDGNDLGGMTLMSGTGKEAEKGGAEAGGAASGSMLGGGESPRSKARREMYGLPGPSDNDKGKAPATAQATTTAPVSIPDLNDDEDDFGLDREEDDEPELQQRIAATSASTRQATTSNTDPLLSSALSKTSSSLAKTLDRIATSLDKHTESNREEGRYFVDVKLHTEAIKDVMAVLETVQKYRP